MVDRDKLRLLAAGCLTFLILGGLMPIFGLALPAIEAGFGVPESSLGLFPGGQAAGSFVVLAAGAMGYAGLRWRSGLVLLAAGSGLVAWHPNFATVIAGAVVLGLGYGACGLIVNRRFMDEFGSNGIGMVGFINAVFGLGAIVAPVGFILVGNDPFACFAAAAVVALAVAPIVRPRAAPVQETAGVRLDPRRLWVLVIPVLAIPLEVGASAFGPKALIEFGMAEAGVAWLMSAFFTTYLVARGAMGWLTRLMDVSWLMFTALVVALVAALLVQAGLYKSGFMLLGAAVSLFFPCFYVWGSRLLDGNPRGSAAIMAAGIGGATVLTPALGAVIGAWGQGALFPALAADAALVALIVFVTIRRGAA